MNRFCPRCGAEVPPNIKFCSKCGQELKMLPPKQTTPPKSTAPQRPVPPPPQDKGHGKAVIAAVCAIALIGGVGTGYYLMNNKKPSSINMNPYMNVSFQGVDGEGYAECEFNLAQMIYDNEKTFSLNDEKRKKIRQICHLDESGEMTDSELITALFADLYDDGPVSVHVEPDNGLSNDDKVTVTWDGGEETLEDLFNINFIFDHSSYVVKNLEKATEQEKVTENEEIKTDEIANTVTVEQNEESAPVENETSSTEKTESKPEKKESKPKTYGKYKLSNTDYLTLRSTPTINNKNNKLLQIPADSEVTVLEFGCNGYWKVKYNDTEGYILPSYLAPAKGAVSPKKTAEYRIITDYVTLRDIPSTDGTEKTKIYSGTVVECYDTADNGYILVQYEGQLGYILKNYNGEILVEKL